MSKNVRLKKQKLDWYLKGKSEICCAYIRTESASPESWGVLNLTNTERIQQGLGFLLDYTDL